MVVTVGTHARGQNAIPVYIRTHDRHRCQGQSKTRLTKNYMQEPGQSPCPYQMVKACRRTEIFGDELLLYIPCWGPEPA